MYPSNPTLPLLHSPTKKTPAVLTLEVNQSNIKVHYNKMLWEDTMEDLQEVGEVNPPQFGRFLGMFTYLFCCGGGFGGSDFVLSKKGQKEGLSRF